mmetsp:Transcript_27370/g.76770  ORF Transcript_27370/g.76770 Transcript_27370/m.76770 type:complete len:265 (+) Transcript_27370:447-1241(+)
MSCMEGLRGFRYCPDPVMVPPVPTPPTRASISPLVSLQISGPVVSRWILGLSGLLNCCSKNPPWVAAISSALPMAPPMPLAAGVRTTSAPKALRSTRRSMLMLSGIVRMSLYPLLAATMANPMPVFPLVGSTRMVLPGVMSPRSSACVIMLSAMRSLTEFAGLEDSSLHTISPTQPSSAGMAFNLTMGVFPISSRTFSAMLVAEEVEAASFVATASAEFDGEDCVCSCDGGERLGEKAEMLLADRLQRAITPNRLLLETFMLHA